MFQKIFTGDKEFRSLTNPKQFVNITYTIPKQIALKKLGKKRRVKALKRNLFSSETFWNITLFGSSVNASIINAK